MRSDIILDESKQQKGKPLNMLISSDGIFIPENGILTRDDDLPYLSGDLKIGLDAAQLKGFKALVDLGLGFYDKVHTLGRSGHAQVGLNVLPNKERVPVIKGNDIYVPIMFQAVGVNPDMWLRRVLRLIEKKIPLKIGRLLSLDNVPRLDKAQMEQALANGDIACGNELRVNDDGSISVRLADISFINDDLAMRLSHKVHDAVLIHSRSGLIPYQDINPVPAPLIHSRSLSIHSIRFSSGIYQSVIRPQVCEQVKHLEGGLYLEAIRSTRIGKQYKASGVRQIELYNYGDTSIEKSDIWITLDIYPADNLEEQRQRYFTSAEQTKFIHRHGISFLQATGLENKEIYQPLFEDITPSLCDDGFYARIITPNGVTAVEWLPTEKFTFNRLQNVINETYGRSHHPSIDPFIAGLSYSKDQGRVLVLYNLPNAEKLIYLVEECGIRSFIFKGMRSRPEDFIAGSLPQRLNVYMDGHLHETLMNLSAEGVAFTLFFDEFDEDDKLLKTHIRELFKGFWCDPTAKVRLDNIEVIVNMYGWHKDHAANLAKDDVALFFKALSKLFGRDKLAVSHGKGPGFMRLADVTARDQGILSIGIGINVEKINQKPNFAPEIGLEFDNDERSYRQKLLDHWGNISVFNVGGFGTNEELAITMCSSKLYEYIPFPIILVDSSEGEHIWKHADIQAQIISTTQELVYKKKDGSLDHIDISNAPLGTKWLGNMVCCVDSYKEAADILARFRDDPVAFWKKAGITAQEITFAWEGQLKLQSKYSQNIPVFITEAVAKMTDGEGV